MNMSNLKPLIRALALILAAAGVAPAQGSTPNPLPLQLKHCAAMTDSGARLTCYDALAGSSVSSRIAPAAPGVSPAQKDMEFGVHNGPLEAKLINPQREKHLLAVVSGISNRPRGELIVTLDNGQVWTQIEASRYPLKTGDHVEIDVGAMGSYVLWCPANRRATKVTRIS
jgi:hypothetical protein